MPQSPHCHLQKRPGVLQSLESMPLVWCTLPQTVEFNWDTDGINFFLLWQLLGDSHGCFPWNNLHQHLEEWPGFSERLCLQFPQAVVGLFLQEHLHSWLDSFRFLQRLGIMSCEESLRTLGLSSLEAEGWPPCSLQLGNIQGQVGHSLEQPFLVENVPAHGRGLDQMAFKNCCWPKLGSVISLGLIGNGSKLLQPRFRLDMRKNLFTEMLVKPWNWAMPQACV